MTAVQLIMKQRGALWRIAISMMRSETEAQDVLAEAVERLWKARARLMSAEDPEAYAAVVLRRVAIDALRRRMPAGAEVEIDSPEGERAAAPVTPERAAEGCSDLDAVRRLMLRLPENQRRVVEMSAFAGLSNAEIEEATGLSPQNVRVLLSRGRQRLRDMFNRLNAKQ